MHAGSRPRTVGATPVSLRPVMRRPGPRPRCALRARQLRVAAPPVCRSARPASACRELPGAPEPRFGAGVTPAIFRHISAAHTPTHPVRRLDTPQLPRDATNQARWKSGPRRNLEYRDTLRCALRHPSAVAVSDGCVLRLESGAHGPRPPVCRAAAGPDDRPTKPLDA
jgi:hypothetical protein